ncbi:MAG: winged helix-turn-helix domain-containing protein, partial [Thermodesulfobacteriota bacterium]|nr:winged helix-turn-helix domain-containing protein [Thermodesulfobacteriota bacterium]
SQVISNDTARAILEALTDESMSTSDIAEKLGIPLTTVQYMDQDTWASWAVIGIDTTTWDWQIAGPHWFMKVPAHGITSQVPGGRLPGSNSLLR